MKTRTLLFLCLIISLATKAQDNSKYLSGSVPEINDKVVFTKTIETNSTISEDKLFELMDQWANDHYKINNKDNSRVLISDAQKKTLACLGDKEIVFKKSALSLDRAFMSYQMIMEIERGKCNVTIKNIRYKYSGDKPELIPAEELITDKVALNKEKTKLNKYYDKFRTNTIDSINGIFTSIDIYLNGVKASTGAATNISANNNTGVAQSEQQASSTLAYTIPSATSVPSVSNIETATTTTSNSLAGYKRIDPDKIPGNIIKLLNDWMLITSGTDSETNTMTASWGGIGVLWEKPVAFCFINPTRHSITTMDKGDTYTISFYTEAYKDALLYCGNTSGKNTDKIKGSGLTPIKTASGATAFGEAWMILECKKILAQQISPDSVFAKDLSSDWSKNGFHKIYVGEILNVWIK